MLLTFTAVQAQELKPLNSDSEPDRMKIWSASSTAKFGPFPKLAGRRQGRRGFQNADQ